MLFDAHTHLNNENISQGKREELAKEIEASAVSYIIDSAFDLESASLAASHSEKYPFCYGTAGYHPHEASKMEETELFLLEGLAKKEGIKAIGEIGLDFFRDISPREVQREAFRKQIQLANRLKMPIVIHSRDADQEVLDILKEEGAFSKERKEWFPKRRGPQKALGMEGIGEEKNLYEDARVLLHCFSGSKELAREYVKLGATISIAGPVTFKNNKKTQNVVREIPIEFLTIETDSPYLTPEPRRGEKNKSIYVEHVANKIAELKEMTYEQVAKETCQNGKIFFNITN